MKKGDANEHCRSLNAPTVIDLPITAAVKGRTITSRHIGQCWFYQAQMQIKWSLARALNSDAR